MRFVLAKTTKLHNSGLSERQISYGMLGKVKMVELDYMSKRMDLNEPKPKLKPFLKWAGGSAICLHKKQQG